jgi:DNA repair protein RadA/Sms
LRTVKNRYGSTNEIGVFEMGEKGLLEVKNASEAFLSGRKEGSFGSAVTCTLEGSRPFLIEVQALTNATAFGYTKRTSSGFDVNRMQLLIAVLQKHAKLNLSNQDVYANIIGGIKLRDPGADLALCLAIASSFTKKSLPADLCTLGEVGLSGEIREIPQLAQRIKEAEKLGFKNILTAKTHQKITSKANITQTNDIQEALRNL